VYTMLIAALLWTSMGVANCTKIVPAVTWFVTLSSPVYPVSYTTY
jgi:hypothetical protein